MILPAKKIDEEASSWTVRLAAGSLAPGEQQGFQEWLASDPRYRGALVRAYAVWLDLDRLAAMAEGVRTAPVPQRPHRRQFLLAAAVATLPLAVATSWVFLYTRGETHVSKVGELRQVRLADGSGMLLNTATKAVVLFDKSSRTVQVARGEAFFEVVADRSRPFIVHAGPLAIRAIGTAFVVRYEQARTDVIVTKGEVEVLRKGESSLETAQRVASNQRATATGTGPIEVRSMQQAEIKRLLSWRAGMVAFDGESLRDAVAEINRYNQRKLIIDDARLAGRQIVGIFRATDISLFTAVVAETLDAEAIDEGDVIRLRARTDRMGD